MTQRDRLRVTHVITGLEVGGAERLLAHLVSATSSSCLHDVVALGRDGPVGDALRAQAVPVLGLALHAPAGLPGAVRRLTRHLRAQRPDVVHTWLVHANVVGGVAARLAGRPVLWSLHTSGLGAGGVRRSTAGLERASATLSHLLADEVVSTTTTPLGRYRADRLLVIPNAAVPFAGTREQARERLLDELQLGPETLLVGHVGRLAPQKDHRTLLESVALVARDRPRVHLVAAGRGVAPDERALAAQVAAVGLAGRCTLLGERADAPELAAAVDVAVSSSAFGETTPLALLEALGAGTPVVTTDVGDCATLVGPGGLVVPPRQPSALARALADLLDAPATERERRGAAGRAHVRRRGGTEQLGHDYEAVYRRIAGW